MTILVTGGTGFIGRALASRLLAENVPTRFAVRHPTINFPRAVVVGDLARSVNWAPALEGIHTVMHLAGHAHVLGRTSGIHESFFRVNVEASRRLAQAAGAAGVRRVIFLSSAKVMGDESAAHSFSERDIPRPKGPYANSKLMAEQAILEAARGTQLSVTIIRAPMVYGPGVRANFLSLLRAVDRRLPLPFGAINNARSLIGVENLVDALLVCARTSSSETETFFVKDKEDLSTCELIRMIAEALGRNVHLMSVPPTVFRLAARIVGRRDLLTRLLGSFTVDSTCILETLGWSPPVSTSTALALTARWYRDTMRSG